MTHEEALAEVKNLDAATLNPDLKKEFCKLWPEARVLLRVLKKIVPKLTKGIDIIIGGGDELSKKICTQ